MKETKFSTSACRFCRFYQPEGRRGGSCQKLGVPVESNWSACTFASSPFETTIEKLEDIFQLETQVSLNSSRSLASQKADVRIEGDRPPMSSPKMVSPKSK